MGNLNYDEQLRSILERLGEGCKMTLATSAEDRVTARTVSCILLDGCFYFQTDRSMTKYRQIQKNPLVALCAGDLQAEGVAADVGKPLDFPEFSSRFERCFPHAYALYTALPEERLVRVRPILLARWCYDGDGRPYRLLLHPEERLARMEYYSPKEEDG